MEEDRGAGDGADAALDADGVIEWNAIDILFSALRNTEEVEDEHGAAVGIDNAQHMHVDVHLGAPMEEHPVMEIAAQDEALDTDVSELHFTAPVPTSSAADVLQSAHRPSAPIPMGVPVEQAAFLADDQSTPQSPFLAGEQGIFIAPAEGVNPAASHSETNAAAIANWVVIPSFVPADGYPGGNGVYETSLFPSEPVCPRWRIRCIRRGPRTFPLYPRRGPSRNSSCYALSTNTGGYFSQKHVAC